MALGPQDLATAQHRFMSNLRQFESFRYRPTLRRKESTWENIRQTIVGRGKRLLTQPGTFLQRAKTIEQMMEVWSQVSDLGLAEARDDIRQIVRRGTAQETDIHRAFAIIAETASRTLGMRPYRVQLAGGLAILSGTIAEMATGEGKTLVAALPAIVIGWQGQGCHILTDNNYLAARDADLMKPLYEACDLGVGVLNPEGHTVDRRAAYASDITYGTSQEVAADYLYDRLALPHMTSSTQAVLAEIAGKPIAQDLRQRGLPWVIVDEADSVLIDGGTTLLIISRPAESGLTAELYQIIYHFAKQLQIDRHFVIHARDQTIELSKQGLTDMQAWQRQQLRVIGHLPESQIKEMVTVSLQAIHQRHRDKHYIIDAGQIVVVDESTGRPRPQVQWANGLHQAVQAKEAVDIQLPTQTLSQISFQKFFNLYRHIGGMTGTAQQASHEFWSTYHLRVVTIPTRLPNLRKFQGFKLYRSKIKKMNAIADMVWHAHQRGQPVLIGTNTIGASEELGELLSKRGLPHTILNARHTMNEAQIVSAAGRRAAITIATNMAGRGTDIKLDSDVSENGGLLVIIAEWQSNRRCQRQLIGRTSRQGQPGQAVVFWSLEDDEYVHRAPWARWSITHVPFIRRFAMSLAQGWIARQETRLRRHLMERTDHQDVDMGFTGSL